MWVGNACENCVLALITPLHYCYYYHHHHHHHHPWYHLYAGYIPETNHISRVYSVAAVLYLQFVLHVMLFRPWNMFYTLTLALSALCAQCPIQLFFCSSLISCSPGMMLRSCLSDFEIVPVAPIMYYQNHFYFNIPHVLNFYYEVLIY